MSKLQEDLIQLQQGKSTIERLVFSGGGPRGAVYPGAFRALVDACVYNNVKMISGSSVGALSAALLAVGVSPKELRKVLAEDFEAKLGKRVGHLWKKNPHGVSFFTRDGTDMLLFIRAKILESIRKVLEKKQKQHTWNLLIDTNANLRELLEKLKQQSPCITFADLAVLTEAFPEQFKTLTITAVNADDGELQLFNARETPDIELALACRASSSLPLILEPVAITINGQTKHYIDGGVYDNIPTDYFDYDAELKQYKNNMREQTLVFSFSGSGSDQELLHALHGQYLEDSMIEAIVVEAVNYLKHHHIRGAPHRLFTLLTAGVVCEARICAAIAAKEDKVLLDAIARRVELIVNKINAKMSENQASQWWGNAKFSVGEQLNQMGQYIIQQLKPKIYSGLGVDRKALDLFIRHYGRFKLNYKLSARIRDGFHNLRRHYPLRTVSLFVGNVSVASFSAAKKHGRVLDALGYLDTINFVTHHGLQNPGVPDVGEPEAVFFSRSFYTQFIDNFEKIYASVLSGAGKIPAENSLLRDIAVLRAQLALKKAELGEKKSKIAFNEAQGTANAEDLCKAELQLRQAFRAVSNAKLVLRNVQWTPTQTGIDRPEDIERQVYYLIKERAQRDLSSSKAFALSRAVELTTGLLDKKTLFKEVYQASFTKSGWFSQSKITGKRVFLASTLEKRLANKDLFCLFKARSNPHHTPTRATAVYNWLKQIEGFDSDFVTVPIDIALK